MIRTEILTTYSLFAESISITLYVSLLPHVSDFFLGMRLNGTLKRIGCCSQMVFCSMLVVRE